MKHEYFRSQTVCSFRIRGSQWGQSSFLVVFIQLKMNNLAIMQIYVLCTCDNFNKKTIWLKLWARYSDESELKLCIMLSKSDFSITRWFNKMKGYKWSSALFRTWGVLPVPFLTVQCSNHMKSVEHPKPGTQWFISKQPMIPVFSWLKYQKTKYPPFKSGKLFFISVYT